MKILKRFMLWAREVRMILTREQAMTKAEMLLVRATQTDIPLS